MFRIMKMSNTTLDEHRAKRDVGGEGCKVNREAARKRNLIHPMSIKS